jgi:hypothetical protein
MKIIKYIVLVLIVITILPSQLPAGVVEVETVLSGLARPVDISHAGDG